MSAYRKNAAVEEEIHIKKAPWRYRLKKMGTWWMPFLFAAICLLSLVSVVNRHVTKESDAKVVLPPACTDEMLALMGQQVKCSHKNHVSTVKKVERTTMPDILVLYCQCERPAASTSLKQDLDAGAASTD